MAAKPGQQLPGVGRDRFEQQVPTLAPIQVIPPGLMGLLQLKQSGRLPADLSGVVQPSLEMRDWFFQGRRLTEVQVLGTTPTTGALVTGNTGLRKFTVGAVATPAQGTLWYVEQMSCICTTALAADVISFVPAIASLSTSRTLGAAYIDTVTARVREASVFAARGFWVGSDETLAVRVIDISTAGITIDCRLSLTVLPI